MDIININATNRSLQYALISRFFHKQISTKDAPVLLRTISFMSEEKQKDYKKLVEKIEKVLQDKEEQNKLHIEYAHLFLLPEGVKPYESVYLGQKSMIYQEPWESVKAFYQDNNMKLDENQLYPEDHISVELAFMSYLIDQNIDEKIQQDFLQQHILRWVPKFLNDLYENSFAKFYKIVAKHGIGFIEEEKKWISYLNS